MAEFSTQYNKQAGKGFKGDFDINEIFDSLQEDTFKPVICEGYGFGAIAKHSGDPEPRLGYTYESAARLGYWNMPVPPGLTPKDIIWLEYSKIVK